MLVSSYAVQQGSAVFGSLASRMDQIRGLQVRLFLHVGRDWKDTREDSELLREFAASLGPEWPGGRRPKVYYDARTLSMDRTMRAAWHAKCVLVDDETAFVISANFTEWAHRRNMEARVLVRSPHLARQLRLQFDSLVQSKQVRRLPGF